MPEILHRVNETIEKRTTDITQNSTKQHTASNTARDPRASQNQNKDKWFIVERIVNSRKRGNKTEYQIKWQGYSSKENTWEPPDDLPNRLIRQFHAQKRTRSKRRKR